MQEPNRLSTSRRDKNLPLEDNAYYIPECSSHQTCLILGPYRSTRDESRGLCVGSYEHVVREQKRAIRPLTRIVSGDAISSLGVDYYRTVIAKFIYSNNCFVPLCGFIEIRYVRTLICLRKKRKNVKVI